MYLTNAKVQVLSTQEIGVVCFDLFQMLADETLYAIVELLDGQRVIVPQEDLIIIGEKTWVKAHLHRYAEIGVTYEHSPGQFKLTAKALQILRQKLQPHQN